MVPAIGLHLQHHLRSHLGRGGKTKEARSAAAHTGTLDFLILDFLILNLSSDQSDPKESEIQ